jgi:CheY-like chemotaxis protein
MWKVQNFAYPKYKPRILIGDQEPHMRVALHDYLSSVGFFVDQAINGQECLELAWNNHPDVILLDLDMPHMQVLRTLRHLRDMGLNIPVLLFSTAVSVPFDEDSAVLQKPFRPKEIAIVLENLLLETKKEKRFLPRRYKVH